MDGYFLFAQKLEVKVVPPEKIHPDLFKGANPANGVELDHLTAVTK